MGIKKKLGMGVATAVLGLGLVGGGTFAYFSDTAEATGDFAAGTLDLSVDPTEVIEVDNLKPGDWMPRSFDLVNGGSLDISEVILNTDYTVEGATGDDFGKHIMVHYLKNEDKSGFLNPSNVITSKTLYELKNMSPDAVENLSRSIFGWQPGENDGLKAGDRDKLHVKFEFVDNEEDQNEFQGASLDLEWSFEAHQTEGERR